MSPSPAAPKTSEAILAVTDVVATVAFYRDVLGFERQWLWGDPPTFAGIGWGPVNLMMCQQPDLAAKVEGHQHMFFTEGDIDALHARHVAMGAPIVSPIENKPWGVREYTVRDPNGYHLRFGGSPAYRPRPEASITLPEFIQVVERLPSIEEYGRLVESAGWNKHTESIAAALNNSLFGVVALDVRPEAAMPAIGMARVVGDGARFFYVQDVVVHPDYQGRRVGSTMMQAVMAWVRRSVPQGGASVGLFTGRPKFYERFGFIAGSGMSLSL